MRDAGCFFVAFGIESGNQKVLDAMKKGITLEQVEAAVKDAKSLGLKTSGFFIIGCPEETYETAMESIRFSESLPLDETRFYNAMPYPGTELYSWVKEHGTFLADMETYLNQMSHQRNKPVFETEAFTAEEREKALAVATEFSIKRNYRNRFGFMGAAAYYFWNHRMLRVIGRQGLSALRKVKNYLRPSQYT
jgi:radical SAM superfamily enzyme YgiQ (UPF0313 family)